MKKIMIISAVFLLVTGFSVFAIAGNATNAGNDRGPLEKITFIHYRDGHIRPIGNPGKGGSTDTSTCYGFLAKGAKWKTTEPYQINPSNTEGISESDVVNAVALSDVQWDDQVSFNIFGTSSVNYSASYNNGSFDGNNTISFGSVSSPGAIAVTNIWGYFSGPLPTRELVEWDMLLDQTDFSWGIGDATKMDLQNIVTHEIGHSAGMGDLYTSKCNGQTMYGYSTEGETSKRDLDVGDIKGIKALYG
jgi:hypothetical protein